MRSANSTETVHRTVFSETLDLQAAPSMCGRQLPRKRRSLEGRPHQSASHTASPHAEKPGGTDPISLARREPASHFALCIYAPHDYVARCSAQLILRNAWAPGLRPSESTLGVPPGLLAEPNARAAGLCPYVVEEALGKTPLFPICSNPLLFSPHPCGVQGAQLPAGCGQSPPYPRTFPVPFVRCAARKS